MRRLLAVLGAVAMVGLAVVVRGAIDDEDGAAAEGDAVVLCSADLAEVCAALGVDHELADAASTAALLVAGDTDGTDAWLTTGAWVEVLRSRAPSVVEETEVLATSPVEVVVDPARADAVQDLCAGAPVLGCLGAHAGEPWDQLGGEPGWGTLKTGVPDVDAALGLAVLPALAAGHFGRLDFAANDFGTDDLAGWLSRLAAPSGSGDADPARTLVTRQGTYSAAVGVAAPIRALTRPVAHVPAQPEVLASVVLVTFPERRPIGTLDAARSLLADAGWTPAGGAATPTLNDGVLAALLSLWTEVTR